MKHRRIDFSHLSHVLPSMIKPCPLNNTATPERSVLVVVWPYRRAMAPSCPQRPCNFPCRIHYILEVRRFHYLLNAEKVKADKHFTGSFNPLVLRDAMERGATQVQFRGVKSDKHGTSTFSESTSFSLVSQLFLPLLTCLWSVWLKKTERSSCGFFSLFYGGFWIWGLTLMQDWLQMSTSGVSCSLIRRQMSLVPGG